jgi:hypothetical protein
MRKQQGMEIRDQIKNCEVFTFASKQLIHKNEFHGATFVWEREDLRYVM